MIADLKPYAEYKESGLPWIGRVPGHWQTRRAKFLLREVDKRSSSGREQLLRVSQYTGVTQRMSLEGSDSPDTRAVSLVGYKLVQPDDLVVNIMLAWNGSMGVSRYPGIVSPAYCVYRFNAGALPWYFHELLRTPAYKQRIKNASTGIVESRLRLYSDDLGRLELPLPPSDEQDAIVRFLDWANGRLERAIRAKRKVIALLNEQKQAIIHRAVTRGLDPSVPLKPSGIPWLGDIPAHWVVKPLKRWVRLNASSLGEKTDPDFEFRYVDIGAVKTGRLVKQLERIRFDSAPSRARRILKRSDTIISTVRTYLKAIWYVDEDANDLIASTGFAVLTPGSSVEPEYLGYVIQSSAFVDRVTANSIGIAYPAIAETVLGRFHVAMPSTIAEQQVIVSHIKSECAPLDAAIEQAMNGIKLLREYRTRLVADVVTGKLDVRDAAARLPDEEALLDTSDTRDSDPEDDLATDEEVDA